MIKAIFFDVDGTLLSFDTHEVPASTRKALEQLKEKEIKLFVATGRSPISFKGLLERIDFEFDGFVFNNGQHVIIDNQVIHDMPLPTDHLEDLIEHAEKNNIAISFSEMDYTYQNFSNDRVAELRRMLGANYPKTNYDDPLERIQKYDLYQMSVYVTPEEEEELFAVAPSLRGVRWHPLFTDIIPYEGGKGVGISKALDYMGLENEEVMAFGDGGNDTEMLAFVKHGIAMGNAVDEAKEAASYVTDHVDEDGVYNALKKYGLVE